MSAPDSKPGGCMEGLGTLLFVLGTITFLVYLESRIEVIEKRLSITPPTYWQGITGQKP
jgi:hypothetical protein